MPQRRSFGPLVTAWLVAACLAGCHGMPRRHVTHAPVIEEMPRELAKVALPPDWSNSKVAFSPSKPGRLSDRKSVV